MAKSSSTTKLKAVIFAGGVGTRMWPISRKKHPKQFEPIIEGKSTLQLTIERIRPLIAYSNIYLSTGKQYAQIIRRQLPRLPQANLILEPQMRDVAPAVGYVTALIAKTTPDEPFAILWSDHLLKNINLFNRVLKVGATYISKNQDKFLFLGQKPRFANQNLGWIETGKRIDQLDGFSIRQFKSWHYRPTLSVAKRYFSQPRYVWNPGYWVVTPRLVLEQYRRFQPVMYQQLLKLQATWGTQQHQKLLNQIYPQFPKISFDDAILEKLEPEKAVVLSADFGWSDLGTWEALKEAIRPQPKASITKGKVFLRQTRDSVVYNYTDQLVTTIDLDGMIVVCTDDVILVCPQRSIPEIKKMLKDFEGTKLADYT